MAVTTSLLDHDDVIGTFGSWKNPLAHTVGKRATLVCAYSVGERATAKRGFRVPKLRITLPPDRRPLFFWGGFGKAGKSEGRSPRFQPGKRVRRSARSRCRFMARSTCCCTSTRLGRYRRRRGGGGGWRRGLRRVGLSHALMQWVASLGCSSLGGQVFGLITTASSPAHRNIDLFSRGCVRDHTGFVPDAPPSLLIHFPSAARTRFPLYFRDSRACASSVVYRRCVRARTAT
jgi:hypothetical protein